MLRAVAAAGLSLGWVEGSGAEDSGAGGGGARYAVASTGGCGHHPSPGPRGLLSHAALLAVSSWLGRATVTQRREGVAGPNVNSEAAGAGRCALGPSQKLPKEPPVLV